MAVSAREEKLTDPPDGKRVGGGSAPLTMQPEPSSSQSWGPALQRRLALTDLMVVVGSLLAAQLIRFGVTDADLDFHGVAGAYSMVSLILGALWLSALSMTRSRALPVLAIGNDEYRRVINATMGTFGVFAIGTMLVNFDIARGYLAIALPLGLVLLLLTRHLWRLTLLRKRGRGEYMDRALIVGQMPDVRYVARKVLKTPQSGYLLAGAAVRSAVDKKVDVPEGQAIPIVGGPEDVVRLVEEQGFDTVIVAGSPVDSQRYLKELSWQLESTKASLVVASRLVDVAGPRIHWRPVEGLPLMSVEMPNYEGSKYAWKRLLDIVTSALALVALTPVMLLIALAVRLDSPGPVLFHQERVGVRGSRFSMHKFRSMVPNAEDRLEELAAHNEGGGVLFKMKSDPRITKVGAFLRRYSLDELPQLWNVLVGEMSLVGPRPPLPGEVEGYEEYTHRRLLVRPGLTGLWQVSGRSDLSWEDSVRLDLYYVENWSLAGDLTIMIKTAKAVIGKDGAY
ncbi:sugar transferase [Arthrobacter sp. NPDC089319]|uniref:sugar transferase n=1 Tax=Arthrobacter sp. NPDC089319 TaxID=3155915 RepID=UPI003415FD80